MSFIKNLFLASLLGIAPLDGVFAQNASQAATSKRTAVRSPARHNQPKFRNTYSLSRPSGPVAATWSVKDAKTYAATHPLYGVDAYLEHSKAIRLKRVQKGRDLFGTPTDTLVLDRHTMPRLSSIRHVSGIYPEKIPNICSDGCLERYYNDQRPVAFNHAASYYQAHHLGLLEDLPAPIPLYAGTGPQAPTALIIVEGYDHHIEQEKNPLPHRSNGVKLLEAFGADYGYMLGDRLKGIDSVGLDSAFKAIRQTHAAVMVIVEAHGKLSDEKGPDTNKHLLIQLQKKRNLSNAHLFTMLGKHFDQADVMMGSCHGGAAQKDIALLPVNSTLIAQSRSSTFNYFSFIEGFCQYAASNAQTLKNQRAGLLRTYLGYMRSGYVAADKRVLDSWQIPVIGVSGGPMVPDLELLAIPFLGKMVNENVRGELYRRNAWDMTPANVDQTLSQLYRDNADDIYDRPEQLGHLLIMGFNTYFDTHTQKP